MNHPGLITIRELLRDPQYKAYFTKSPQLPDHYTPATLPWKLMVLKPDEKSWRSKRFGTYKEAFTGLKKVLPSSVDALINSPALGFAPPMKTYKLKGKFDKKGKPLLRTVVWKPRIEADMPNHHWCPHCRRPTIFIVAALGKRKVGRYELPASEPALRCCICGSSENIINMRHPELEQAWDLNRPKVYL